jgi:hypothetical protein
VRLDFCLTLCENGRVPIVDFHTHVFSPDVIVRREDYLRRDRWFRQLYSNPAARMATADELVHSMDRCGVDAAVCFGFPWADQGLCREANDYLLDATARWPRRLFGFAVLNPAADGAEAEVERCLEKGLHGVGELMPDGQGYGWEDRRLDRLVQAVSRRGRPVLLHCGEPVGHDYAGKSSSTLRDLYELALRNRDAVLVAAHWGGGLFFYELMPEVQAALRNVYYDTAASLYLYDDAVFALAAQLVPTKTLFATDYPLIDQERFLRRLRAAGLSGRSLEGILGGNAAQLLGLGG